MPAPFVIECWRCHKPITAWSEVVEDKDGDPICSECHQEAIDQARDEMQDAPLGSQTVKRHDDTTCSEYNEPVLPDEDGCCSLCGADLHPVGAEAEAND